MQIIYDDEATEGILLVDAKNAFNSLNREAALHNVQYLCPALATSLFNCYQRPSRLFVSGGGELQSEEGTTQADPLSTPFYALATLPLIHHLERAPCCTTDVDGRRFCWSWKITSPAPMVGHTLQCWEALWIQH